MFDWKQIETVILDMDGTLLDLHFDNYFWLTHLPKRYAEYHNMDSARAKKQLTELIQSYEGTLQWYCLDHWSELVKMDIIALKREVQHKIQPRPHTKSFLQFLQQQNKKVILATNCHRSGLDLKLSVSQIDQWLDIVISSHDYQAPKEAVTFWQKLYENESFELASTVFVDDNVSVLRSAKQFGLEHLICITQPDSQKPIRTSDEFIDIVDFHEIIPDQYA